jgi:hypothetical protein
MSFPLKIEKNGRILNSNDSSFLGFDQSGSKVVILGPSELQ